MSGRVRVLIVDDSRAIRDAFTAWLAESPTLEVVGVAEDGRRAVELAAQLRPDVITMDMQMPMMDGYEAIRTIMAQSPSRILAVCSLRDPAVDDVPMKALTAGALELLAKPRPGEDLSSFGSRLVDAISSMAAVPVKPKQAEPPSPQPVRFVGPVAAIGVVSSTGGPPALSAFLNRFGGTLPIPIFVAQHITTGFTAGLIRWLEGVTPLRVKVARGGEKASPATVYFPPDGTDLVLTAHGLMQIVPPQGPFCPSGDRLLKSLATVYGMQAAGVVLSGMGEDGAQGLRAIHDAGGATFAQDESTSVVFGMPEAARQSGGVLAMLPPTEIALALRRLASRHTSSEDDLC